MSVVIFVIKNVAILLLGAVELAMLARAILSWFPIFENKIVDFLYAITEPFIYPVRQLFVKMNWFQDTPLDVAYMATYLVLALIQLLLGTVVA